MSIFSQYHAPVLLEALRIHSDNGLSWTFPSHSHSDSTELNLILEGDIQLELDGELYLVHPGDLIIKRPTLVHKERALSNKPITFICFQLRGIHFTDASPEELLRTPSHAVLETWDRMDLFVSLFTYIERNHKTRAISEEMLNTIFLLIRELEAEGHVRVLSTSSKSDLIKNIKKYIDVNYSKKLSLSHLSEQFFISAYHLERRFTEETGTSVTRYIIDRRMGEAQRMLLFTSDSIREIAEKCGYNDIHYFYKVFKEYTGVTPLQFRQKY